MNTAQSPDLKDIPDLRFYMVDMNLASEESMSMLDKDGVQGDIAGPYGLSSGDMYCFMCYDDQYVWAYVPDSGIYINVDHLDECEKSEFCNSKDGTYLNQSKYMSQAKRTRPSVYGDAGSGDCIHQFMVKDW